MPNLKTLTAAYLLDWLAGDPEGLPHPVRLIGRATQAGETWLRRPGQSSTTQLAAGTALTLGVVALAWYGTAQAIAVGGTAAEVLLGWTCLATRNLVDESLPLIEALQRQDLPHARRRLARIVGRDTHSLAEAEIHRALIETLAESACDGIIAPLLYMAVGGVPLAMAYKAVNTLDSMIGHADQRYFYFGKAAARLDDLANFLPARLTALAIVVAAGTTGRAAAWHTWRRDGQKHKSPNAGNPEAALAGALGVCLGGENTYAGECIATPLLGADFPPPSLEQAQRAIKIVCWVSILGALAAAALAARPRRT
jgi:adenosylcobinamide-phosphate synthase